MPAVPPCSAPAAKPITATEDEVPVETQQPEKHRQEHVSEEEKERGGTTASSEPPVISFSSGLPGFPDAHHFTLASLGKGMDPFCRLVCKDQRGVEFVAVAPEALFADYKVRIDDDTAAELGIRDTNGILVLNIVTLPAPGHTEKPTINLLGPIVINKQTLAARQIVLHDTDYGVAEPLSA